MVQCVTTSASVNNVAKDECRCAPVAVQCVIENVDTKARDEHRCARVVVQCVVKSVHTMAKDECRCILCGDK